MTALDRRSCSRDAPLDGPYVLYAGKLATNKGVQYLLPALDARRASTWPLVVVGDGPLRARARGRGARSRGSTCRVLGWRDRDEVWAWMRHAHAAGVSRRTAPSRSAAS